MFGKILLILLGLWCIWTLGEKSGPRKSKLKKNSKKPIVQEVANITTSQFCEGCRLSVDIFTKYAASALEDMKAKNAKLGSSFDPTTIVGGFCDKNDFAKYQNFIKFSCIKLFDDFGTEFLTSFQGNHTYSDLLSRSFMFGLKKEICVEKSRACAPEEFSIQSDTRDQCQACRIITRDLLRYFENLKPKTGRQIGSSMEYICNSLGFNHSPYAYLENICEELAEDRIAQLNSIKKFYDKVSQSFTPDKSFPDMVCDEIFLCDKTSSTGKSTSTSTTSSTSSSTTSSSSTTTTSSSILSNDAEF